MPNHEIKQCPRCTRNFECKVGNIAACQCNGIRLTIEEQLLIEEKYNDCLCVQCLQTIRFQYLLHKNHIFKW